MLPFAARGTSHLHCTLRQSGPWVLTEGMLLYTAIVSSTFTCRHATAADHRQGIKETCVAANTFLCHVLLLEVPCWLAGKGPREAQQREFGHCCCRLCMLAVLFVCGHGTGHSGNHMNQAGRYRIMQLGWYTNQNVSAYHHAFEKRAGVQQLLQHPINSIISREQEKRKSKSCKIMSCIDRHLAVLLLITTW